VDEFWAVIGGMSSLDSISALAMSNISIHKIIFFDRDPLQVHFGKLIISLLQLCPTRERFVECLFGRSMKAWGRLLSVSTMLDFLDLPVDRSVADNVRTQLPADLHGLYDTVFQCVAHREGWPLVWPSFGNKEKLPIRELSNAKRRLGGGRNEALHINEAGWLKDEKSYGRVRTLLASARPLFKHMELADGLELAPGRRVVWISNIVGSPQFLDSNSLDLLRDTLTDGPAQNSSTSGTLLLSTKWAEWLSSCS